MAVNTPWQFTSVLIVVLHFLWIRPDNTKSKFISVLTAVANFCGPGLWTHHSNSSVCSSVSPLFIFWSVVLNFDSFLCTGAENVHRSVNSSASSLLLLNHLLWFHLCESGLWTRNANSSVFSLLCLISCYGSLCHVSLWISAESENVQVIIQQCPN